jgi:hypothetical protein
MVLAEGIRKHGFRKWYERQLLRGHGHMALTFLCRLSTRLLASGRYHSRPRRRKRSRPAAAQADAGAASPQAVEQQEGEQEDQQPAHASGRRAAA